jgi:hypothetical protein
MQPRSGAAGERRLKPGVAPPFHLQMAASLVARITYNGRRFKGWRYLLLCPFWLGIVGFGASRLDESNDRTGATEWPVGATRLARWCSSRLARRCSLAPVRRDVRAIPGRMRCNVSLPERGSAASEFEDRELAPVAARADPGRAADRASLSIAACPIGSFEFNVPCSRDVLPARRSGPSASGQSITR